MKFRDLKIGAQLTMAFSILLLFVIVLGIVSYRHTEKMHVQTELIYNHPLKVQRAVGGIAESVNQLHWAMEIALSFDDYERMKPYVKIIKENDAMVRNNLALLEGSFLGPHEYIDELRTVMSECKENRDLVFHLIQAGNLPQAERINIHTGTMLGSEHLNEINGTIEKIRRFADQKAHELENQSRQLKSDLGTQILIVTFFMIIIALIITYLLLHTIRSPLSELTETTRRFDRGDMSARCLYKSRNELGMLAESFNTLAENIRINTDTNEKSAFLSDKMLSENDAKSFFETTLEILMDHVGAQMGAVYLLNDNEIHFDHFVSFGLEGAARTSFSATETEGEFGVAVQTGKIQYIKDIPEDTNFIFPTVGGKFVPREIITIPVLSGQKVIAVISLASVTGSKEIAIPLINKIYLTYCARVEGIMAYRRIKEISEMLTQQNRELAAQKIELSAQSSELAAQNRELEVQKDQLSEANRLKTSFLSNMSHELRTPLNSVIALSSVLNKRLVNQIPDEEYSYLEIIERNGRNLLKMINDILDIARIESGREEFEITEFRICNCINEVAEMVRPQAVAKKIGLNPASGDCQTKITGDADKVQHILQNLIGNAVKFTEEGSVDIFVKKLEDTVEICIADTGIGIEADQLQYIFNEFRQVDSGNTRRYEGTGLGLAIAQKYATLLGGDISVESSLGRGSKFTLTLPLFFDTERKIAADDGPVGPGPETRRGPTGPVRKISVPMLLLVEDSEPAVIQIQEFLQSSGYQTLVARNGSEALQIMSGTVPDAIILDLMMPGIDGFEVLRIMRNEERTAHVPVLILTAKQITREELKFLKQNNVYQLIQKGDVKKRELLKALEAMTSPPQPEQKKPEHSRQRPAGTLKVLVVEDDADDMIAIKALLADRGIVLEAYDGETGVLMARQHMPDLVLMDISLPQMDGIEALQKIRNDQTLAHVPIIALTTDIIKREREKLLNHGFDALITKPIDEKLFHKTIHEIRDYQ